MSSSTSPTSHADGAWTPLRSAVFRSLWLASLGSNIGTWLQNVTAGWEMTNLTTSPLLVAMVQVAVTAPAFLLAVAAGALADVVDRRSILIGTQIAGAIVAALLALITATGQLNASLLLLLTFMIGVQSAVMTPAWAANVGDVVPRVQLPAAIALGSLSFNISRAVGPALGGLLLSVTSPAVCFALNALSFVGVLIVLLRWKRPRVEPTLAPEGLFDAMRGGIRYLREEPSFAAILVRCALFSTAAAANFALLPLVAKQSTFSSPNAFALLLTAIGVGAVGAALRLPQIRRRFSRDAVVNGGALLFAGGLALMAATRQFAWLLLAALMIGAAWISSLSSLQIAAQLTAPAWVRARALAVYFMTLNGSIALGGVVWGTLASQAGVPVALGVAALTLVALLPAGMRFVVSGVDAGEPAPHEAFTPPHPDDRVPDEAGPVTVQIEYSVLPAQRERFAELMRELGRLRRRSGAYAWECSFDIRERDLAVEHFQLESWLAHLRQHARMGSDLRALQAEVRTCCLDAPRARHFVSIRAGGLALSPHPPTSNE